MDTYEKKYNEILAWAKKYKARLNGVPIEEIFPELRESEDERIRKWLVDYFSSIKETVWIHRDITCEQILEWLEKQKEPTKEELYAEAGTTENEYIANTMKMVRAMREKQKEQKPAEKQDYSGLNDLERVIHRGFLCAGVENVPVTIIKDTAAECMGFLALIEPKPAEWSEEDEAKKERLISIVKRALHGNEYPILNDNGATELITWLKSLRPQPHWKPSEEQMKALDNARFCKSYDRSELDSLFEQLQKL